MEYKVFDKPHSHDPEFYKDREMADHINQPEHQGRLFTVLAEVNYILKKNPNFTVSDLGCGNGGLLHFINTDKKWGYDLQPSNVADAKEKGRSVELKDFVNDIVVYGDIVVLTETLEHLVDPHGLLLKLKKFGVKYIVASTPGYETPEYHAPFHLWVWTERSFAEMFEKAGWKVEGHKQGTFQFVTASNL